MALAAKSGPASGPSGPIGSVDDPDSRKARERERSRVGRRFHDDGISRIRECPEDEIEALLRSAGDQDLVGASLEALRGEAARRSPRRSSSNAERGSVLPEVAALRPQASDSVRVKSSSGKNRSSGVSREKSAKRGAPAAGESSGDQTRDARGEKRSASNGDGESGSSVDDGSAPDTAAREAGLLEAGGRPPGPFRD